MLLKLKGIVARTQEVMRSGTKNFQISVPKSGATKKKSKKWSVEEIERLHEALSVLPEIFLNLPNVKIYRMQKSKFAENPATSNNNDITLYDSAFEHKDSLAQILSHELSHSLYRKLTDKEKATFRKAAEWIEHPKFKGALTTKKNKKFIQPDSQLSVDEDFSNHVEHFLFKNKSLKKDSPKAHLWIRKKYGQDFRIEPGVKK